MPFVLSLDEGTTSARAALYDEQGRNVAMESAPVECRYPQAGWVEQDADEIWNAQLYAARLLLDRAGVPASQIVAAGITNQRETTVVWERATGRRWRRPSSGNAAAPRPIARSWRKAPPRPISRAAPAW
jgi:glycerol kinase